MVPHRPLQANGQMHWLVDELHACPEAQPPHATSVRWSPQLSTPDLAPHSAPSREQKAALDSGMQTHALFEQLSPVPEHVPQLVVLGAPQLSVPDLVPQAAPVRAQKAALDSGAHTHWFAPEQLSPVPEQPPQLTLRLLPQLSVPDLVPHSAPKREQKAALDSGLQEQVLFEQLSPVPEHVPQLTLRLLPQLSVPDLVPHSAPRRAQKVALDSGLQEQVLFEQLSPVPEHVPQFSVRWDPQLSAPEVVPHSEP